MRTNIVIDDSLMQDALKATGLKTKKEAVELGLKVLIKLHQQEAIKAFRGKNPKWEDNAEEVEHQSMILVDSSVWIDYFNGQATPETNKLDALLGVEPLGIGDSILT